MRVGKIKMGPFGGVNFICRRPQVSRIKAHQNALGAKMASLGRFAYPLDAHRIVLRRQHLRTRRGCAAFGRQASERQVAFAERGLGVFKAKPAFGQRLQFGNGLRAIAFVFQNESIPIGAVLRFAGSLALTHDILRVLAPRLRLGLRLGHVEGRQNQEYGQWEEIIYQVSYQLPIFSIEAQGSCGGRASPACNSSIDTLSGERTKAMRPSRGGRLMAMPACLSFSQVA